MIPLVLALHTTAAVIWVGGMFFAVVALRPALLGITEVERLKIWRIALGRFFNWIWVSIAVLLATGYDVVFFGYEGFATVGLHIRIMQITGLLMTALFLYVYTRPWQDFRHAVDHGDDRAAEKALRRIALVISINMPLGVFTAAIGATGGFWTY